MQVQAILLRMQIAKQKHSHIGQLADKQCMIKNVISKLRTKRKSMLNANLGKISQGVKVCGIV